MPVASVQVRAYDPNVTKISDKKNETQLSAVGDEVKCMFYILRDNHTQRTRTDDQIVKLREPVPRRSVPRLLS